MALSAKTLRTYSDVDSNISNLPVKASSTIYEGSAVGLTAGYARALVAGDIFGGFCLQGIIAPATDGVANVAVQRRGLVTLAITSLAVTDIGKPVYASDDGTFTLTQSTNSPIGRVQRWLATGSGVIEFNAACPARLTSIALLTGGTNITAATANGVLIDSSATNPTDTQYNDLAKEVLTKINEIINALK